MPESPYGLAYGLGSATSNMLGSYMQGQQYGLQREAQKQQMEIAKQQAARQDALSQAQIEHYGMQNQALQQKTAQDAKDYSLSLLGDALDTGNWEKASEIGKQFGYEVAPHQISRVTQEGEFTDDPQKSAGVAFMHGDEPMFVSNDKINEWKFGKQGAAYAKAIATRRLQNEGNLDVAGVRKEASQYRDDRRLEGVKYSADKHYDAVIGNARIRAAAERALSSSGGGKKTDTQRAAEAFAEQAGRVDKNGNPKPNADDYRDARRLWSEGNPGSFNGRIFSVLEANDPKFRKLDADSKSREVLNFYEKLGKHKERQPGGGNGGGGTAPDGTRVKMADGTYQVKRNGQWVKE